MRRISTAAMLPSILIAALAAGPAAAKRNITAFALEYRPTEAAGAPKVVLPPEITALPVALTFADDRRVEDGAWIGTRTDDADVRYDLTATNDVATWAEDAVRQCLARWGIEIRDDAPRTLEVSLLVLETTETNQAVGATYASDVRLRVRLRDAGGRWLWEGIASGDANRYGKKFSADNANEVLSDGMAEAVAQTLEVRDLQEAWLGETPATPGVEETRERPAVGPAALLAEIRKLMDQKLAVETIVDFVEGRRLTAALGADDVVAWKEAGVPEPVIRAALRLPVAD